MTTTDLLYPCWQPDYGDDSLNKCCAQCKGGIRASCSLHMLMLAFETTQVSRGLTTLMSYGEPFQLVAQLSALQ